VRWGSELPQLPRAFAAVVERGLLTGAARRLGRNVTFMSFARKEADINLIVFKKFTAPWGRHRSGLVWGDVGFCREFATAASYRSK
jgi:hypothetical protein